MTLLQYAKSQTALALGLFQLRGTDAVLFVLDSLSEHTSEGDQDAEVEELRSWFIEATEHSWPRDSATDIMACAVSRWLPY